jgi:hypothetical protein
MTDLKLGRAPRIHNPAMPKMAMIRQGRPALPPPPAAVHYAEGMPPDFGMMLNDSLGCCTAAAMFHAMQVWSFHGRSKEYIFPDDYVLKMYEAACGYVPGHPETDQGGVEQKVLAYCASPGVMIPQGRSIIRAVIEVDVKDTEGVRHAINDCGGVYIGFDVPAWLMEGEPPAVWSTGADTQSVGGHAVFLPGYDAEGPDVISWGKLYRMTWEFFTSRVDEAYCLAHPWWIDATGKTPAGLTEDQMREQMAALARQAQWR